MNSRTTTRISQTWFASQTGPMACSTARRCASAARAGRQQVPDAAAEVGARRTGSKTQRRADDAGQRELSRHGLRARPIGAGSSGARRRPRSGAPEQIDHGHPEQQVDEREQPERRRQVREGVTASAVRIRPRTIHGCRPHSVTSQPASIATNPSGPSSANASSQRRPSGSRLRGAAPPPRRRPPPAPSRCRSPTMIWNARADRARAATRRAGTPRGPPRSRRDRRTRGSRAPTGISIAPRNSPVSTSGNAADVQRGAALAVRKCASTAASFSGCATATCFAERSPESGCTSAVTHATGSASASALRCSVRAGSRSRMTPRDAHHRQRRRLVAGEQHVHHLVRPRRAPHRRHRIAAPRPGRRPVHERVDQRHEDRRRRAADRHRDAGDEVQARRDAVAAVEVDAEEDRLGEEREPLERERQPDRLAERRP